MTVSMRQFPDYLQPCISLHPPSPHESTANGLVICECGHPFFEALYPGETFELDGRPYPSEIERGADYFFLVEAKCAKCKQTYLLFDQDFHGWDGFQCHRPERAAIPRPLLTPWICLSCGQLPHRISIKLQHADLPEYRKWLESAGKPFDENAWLLSFEWIFMTIECANCGLVTKDWVSHETA